MHCNYCHRESRPDAKFCDQCGARLTPTNATNILPETTMPETTNGPGKSGPLDGIRVIDWTMWQFGPVSTLMLADLGAEVIKVESLDGDHGRQFTRVSGIPSLFPDGTTAYFECNNRQKKSIALDLKNPKGVEVMYDLAARSDVLVENFRNGVAERMGLGYEEVSKRNPMIVYGSATGYGAKGPDSAKPAFALTGEARSGALFWAGPDDGNPYSAGGVADQMGGIMLSYGILGALVARERLGIGQKVDASHLGSMMWLGGLRYGMALLNNAVTPRPDRRMARNPLWNYYQCRDGRWLAFSMNQGDRFWPFVCSAIDRADLVDDPRFNSMGARTENREELVSILDSIFITKTLDEWAEVLEDSDSTIWERVQDVFDLPNDPQVTANDYIIDFDHPLIGPSKWVQTPVAYNKTPISTRKMAPAHGEHTEEVLIDTLGYTWDDIGRLQEAGVIL